MQFKALLCCDMKFKYDLVTDAKVELKRTTPFPHISYCLKLCNIILMHSFLLSQKKTVWSAYQPANLLLALLLPILYLGFIQGHTASHFICCLLQTNYRCMTFIGICYQCVIVTCLILGYCIAPKLVEIMTDSFITLGLNHGYPHSLPLSMLLGHTWISCHNWTLQSAYVHRTFFTLQCSD